MASPAMHFSWGVDVLTKKALEVKEYKEERYNGKRYHRDAERRIPKKVLR